jgi:predicted nucleic acid-binding protein
VAGYLLDTSIAIGLRDDDPAIVARAKALGPGLVLSIVTRVELEGGVYRDPLTADIRRRRLDILLAALPVLPFDADAAEAYGAIVREAGYSRRKLLDRMIAAQAIVNDATLVTLNPVDFADIPGLKLLAW